MTFLTGNCRWLTSQPNRTRSGLSNSQHAGVRGRHRRLSRAPAGPGGLSSLRCQAAESSRQRNLSAGGFQSLRARSLPEMLTPPWPLGGQPTHHGAGDSSPPRGRGEGGGTGWVLGGARGVHLPASEARQTCRVPSPRASGLGPTWADREKPTDQAGGTCVSIRRLPVSLGGKDRPAAAVGAAGSLPSSPLSPLVCRRLRRGPGALGWAEARLLLPPGPHVVGRCFRPGALVFYETGDIQRGGAASATQHVHRVRGLHGCRDHGMPTDAHLPLSPFKGHFQSILRIRKQGFPGGSEGKASACNAGGLGSIPGSGRSPGEGNGHPLHYSCLKSPMDGVAWQAAAHGVAESDRTE